ncbi:MAG: hypothetical protein ACK4SX_07680 [Alcanivoracaceae bacterium]
MIRSVVVAIAVLATVANADTLYRCASADGVPLFANRPCDEHSEPLVLPEIGRIGSDDQGEALRQRTEALAKIAGIEPERRTTAPPPTGLSFGERMTLRKLEIRRDGLRRDVSNTALTSAYRKALSDELALVNQRIRELERRR